MIDSVILDVSPMARAGRERGIGRYSAACVRAADHVANATRLLVLEDRGNPRLNDWIDMGRRTSRLRAMPDGIFHATYTYTLAATRRPTVVSVQDVIPLDCAGYQKFGVKAKVLHRLAAKADVVLTNTEYTASRIAETMNVDRSRIVCAPLPPAPSLLEAPKPVQEGVGGRSPYVFALIDMATTDPRKRAYLVPALASHLRDLGVELLIAGARTREAFGEVPGVRALGRVSDARLAELYRAAVAFCYFSSYEGQGMPPLEAMANGTPVIALGNSAVTEVVGNGGHLIPEPWPAWNAPTVAHPFLDDAVEEMARVAHEWAASSPQESSARETRAIAQASGFSWERFTAGVGEAYALAQAVRSGK